jgi:general L-amino acid transport system permease protein
LLTLVVASTGVLGSMPLGALLALARFSEMPALRWSATLFIEFWRAVPLVVALFAFVVCFPLFIPGGRSNIDLLLRTVVGFAVFNSAFMAEVFRGGLQSVPNSQFEAAKSIGLSWRQMMMYIVLPSPHW